jgi:hypothetical protein
LAKVLPFPSSEQKVIIDNNTLKQRIARGWKGLIFISDDFDDESPEVNAMFYGEGE